jgi:hypothetical protein
MILETKKFKKRQDIIQFCISKYIEDKYSNLLLEKFFWNSENIFSSTNGWTEYTEDLFEGIFGSIKKFTLDVDGILYRLVYSNHKIKLEPI